MSKGIYDKNIGISSYEFNGKTYLTVKVQKRNKDNKVVQRASRYTSSGKRITSLLAAERVKDRLRRELDQIAGSRSKFTWETWRDEAVSKMRRDGFKESTLVHYNERLDKWVPKEWVNRDISSFTKEDVYDFIHDYMVKKGASDWTRRGVCKKVRRLFEMALEDEEISRNPAKGVKVSVKADDGQAFTSGEIKILLEKGKALSHPYYPHWVVALLTGMRNGELYALRWSDVDLDSGIIRVMRQFTNKDGLHAPKNGRSRPIDLDPELKRFLLELKGSEGCARETLWEKREDKVLVDEFDADGEPTGEKVYEARKVKESVVYDDLILPRVRSWRKGQQAASLKAFCRQIGIRELKFHDLRATHITHLLDNGATISKVMKQVGHQKMSTTDGYHRLTGVAVKGVTKHLNISVPSVVDEIPDNIRVKKK